MARPAPALRQIVEEIGALGEIEHEYGDEDGLSRYRSVSFDSKTSKKAHEVVEAAGNLDPRIASVDYKPTKGKEKLTVTVVGDTRADFRDSFDIADALVAE